MTSQSDHRKIQRWSPRGRPWPRGRPRGHILKSLSLASKVKSLASKPQVLENCPVLGSRTVVFFEPLKLCIIISVTAPICFIYPTKFSNSALLFGSYFCCVSLRVIVFFNFRTFRSTPNFRHNAQLFCFFAEF